MTIDQYIIHAPIRWFVAYALIQFGVLKIGFKAAEKVFGFDISNAY